MLGLGTLALLAWCIYSFNDRKNTVPDMSVVTESELIDVDQALFKLLELIPSEQPDLVKIEQTIMFLSGHEDRAQAVAPLVHLLRFASPTTMDLINDGLWDITGENIRSWSAWIDYLSNRESVELPPNYILWKGEHLSIIDADFRMFFKADTKLAPGYRPELAVWGGVAVANQPGFDKGIPPLEEPVVIKGQDASFLRDSDIVYALVVDGVPRAYPQRIIDWHEMVNDVIKGQHFSIAYCTLCGAAVAYDTQLPDGTFRTFSSSGLLQQSNKVMFDRQTNTLWNHLLGTPVAGPLVGEVERLPILPIETTRWDDWIERYPDTEVVDIVQTGFRRDYSQGVPSYNRYYDSPETLFPVGTVPGPFLAKDRIFGITDGVFSRVYKRDTVWEKKVINDEFANNPTVVISEGEGLGIRAYERGDRTFSAIDNPEVIQDSDGKIWTITDKALVHEDEVLERLSAHEAFWFGWIINYPGTSVYKGGL